MTACNWCDGPAYEGATQVLGIEAHGVPECFNCFRIMLIVVMQTDLILRMAVTVRAQKEINQRLDDAAQKPLETDDG